MNVAIISGVDILSKFHIQAIGKIFNYLNLIIPNYLPYFPPYMWQEPTFNLNKLLRFRQVKIRSPTPSLVRANHKRTILI